MKSFLSTRQLGQAIGVSESTLKRWADDDRLNVTRTAGGHRRIALTEAIRFIRHAQLRVVRPEVLGLTDFPSGSKLLDVQTVAPQPPAELLFQALFTGREQMARQLLLSAFLHGQSLAEICDQLMQPALVRFGAQWHHQADGIYREHRATDMVLQALNQIRSLLPAPKPDAPLALGGAPGSDPYLLPTLMASTVLTAEGWHALNLGPATPLDVLEAAAVAQRCRLCWLSLSNLDQSRRELGQIAAMGQRLAARGIALIVGGRACVGGLPNVEHLPTIGRNMRELVAFARGLNLQHKPAQPAALAAS